MLTSNITTCSLIYLKTTLLIVAFSISLTSFPILFFRNIVTFSKANKKTLTLNENPLIERYITSDSKTFAIKILFVFLFFPLQIVLPKRPLVLVVVR